MSNDPVPGTTATVRPSDGLRLRGEPSTAAQILEMMPQGTEVTLTGGRQNGFVAATHGGQAGWAFSAYLAAAGNKAVAPVARVTAGDGLRLRGGPSTDAQILETMPQGTLVARTDASQDGFLAVSHDGVAGWAFAGFLDLIDPGEDLPQGGPDGPNGWEPVNQWQDAIQAAAGEFSVPANLIKAVMRLESNGDPGALGAAGVVGLMQIYTKVWGHGPWEHDNAANIRKGAQILRIFFDESGSNWYEALRHYHGIGWDGNTWDWEYADIITGYWQQLGA